MFNTDHIIFGPSIEKLKTLNLAAFKLMGDMNWHNHCGITTYPGSLLTNLKFNSFRRNTIGCLWNV